MANEKRLIWDEDAQHRLVALAVKRGSDAIPLDMITYILFNESPAVDDVEVVHGRWISYLDGDSIMPDRYYRCSECCDRGWRGKWPYCPNCGAKMDGDKHE